MLIKNIIFDFDGTLVDSSEDIIRCLISAYKVSQVNPKISITKNIIGPPIQKIIRYLSPDISAEQEKEIITYFRNLYDNCEYPNTFLYEGVINLLSFLKTRKKKIFIVTNKPWKATRKIIEKLNINYFEKVICSDSFSHKDNFGKLEKSDLVSSLINETMLDRNATVLVGDSIEDIEAAHKNNLKGIAILSGYGQEDKIRESKPNFILKSIEELTDFIIAFENNNLNM